MEQNKQKKKKKNEKRLLDSQNSIRKKQADKTIQLQIWDLS